MMKNKKRWFAAAGAALVLMGGAWAWKEQNEGPVLPGRVYSLDSVTVREDGKKAVWWCGNAILSQGAVVKDGVVLYGSTVEQGEDGTITLRQNTCSGTCVLRFPDN